MVEIMRTNIQDVHTAKRVVERLSAQFPCLKFNFDLEDCDKILRAEGAELDVLDIIYTVLSLGYSCEVLEE